MLVWELRHYARGVVWPWPGEWGGGVSVLSAQRGAALLAFAKKKKSGVLGSVLGWKDEQLEGWRPVGAGRGHRGQSHSKPWLPAQRYRVKEDHASGGEKELLFPPVAHKGHSHAVSQADSPKQQPHPSLVM